jgi:hypothetical protein
MPEYGGLGDRIKELESQVAKLNRARKLESASIGSGGLRVSDGGKITFLDTSGNTLFTIDENGLITFEADGSQLSVLDGSKLRFNRADGTRSLEITPAGGTKFYASNGSTVMTTLDATGLQVIGGYVTPSLSEIQIGQATDVSLTTTPQDVVTLTMTPPSWAQQVYGFVIATAQVSESSSAKNCKMTPRIETSDFGDRTQGLSTSPATESWTAATSISTDRVSLPASFDVHCRVNLNTGTNSTNLFNLYAFADYRRTT